MIFSLEVLRAGKGDCLLIHLGTKRKPGLVLIDGGPATVYTDYLRPRLQCIRKARGMMNDQALEIDLMMVSHVDDDHIHGLLDLMREETNLRPVGPRQIVVKSLWHNSFDALIKNALVELKQSAEHQFGEAAVTGNGELDEEKLAEIEEQFAPEQAEVVHTCLKVLAGVEQGLRLRNSAIKLDFPLNPEAGGALIVASKNAGGFEVGDGKLRLRVLGPMLPELQQLQSDHVEMLRKLRAAGKSPSEILAAYVDESVANLSSIVVLAEAEGKSILLTGDARGDKILEGLDLLEAKPKQTFEVDILKVPHHGSANNVELDFFRRVVAKHYVLSGNGEHGNPERETLEMLLKARGDKDYIVHLTYPIDEIDAARKSEWDNQRKKQLARRKKNPNARVRPKWSPAAHSLAAFLERNANFKSKVRIVEEGVPHVINLADPA